MILYSKPFIIINISSKINFNPIYILIQTQFLGCIKRKNRLQTWAQIMSAEVVVVATRIFH